LKYTTVSGNSLKANTLWKYYQNKNNSKTTSTPAHLILTPSDNNKILNFMKFSDMGNNNLKDSTTFKKIQCFSKSNPQKLFNNLSEFDLKYKKLSDLYLTDHETLDASSYGIKRQHNFTSRQSLLNNSNSHLDSKSIETYISYNQNMENYKPDKLNNSVKFHNHTPATNTTNSTLNLVNKLNTNNPLKNDLSLPNYLAFIDKNILLSAENDSASNTNPLKFALHNK
jgi:hypothetical protein